MDAYTYIAKPTSSTYSYVNFPGTQTYDDAFVSYDDPSVFYDSVNYAAWTDIAKPTGLGTIKPGMATGLIMPPTYSTGHEIDPWIKIPKPS